MDRVKKWNFIISLVGIIILFIAYGILLMGSSLNNAVFSAKGFFALHYADISLQLISTSFTILFIDRLYAYRERGHYQMQLIMQMRSGDSGASRLAILEFVDNGWLQKGELRGKVLNGAIFEGITFPEKSIFSEASLRKSNFSHAVLHNASFYKCDLREAKLSFAKISLTDFNEANLIKADLTNADFSGSNLAGALLQGADLSGAIFTNCNIENWDISDAITDKNTILPNGLSQ